MQLYCNVASDRPVGPPTWWSRVCLTTFTTKTMQVYHIFVPAAGTDRPLQVLIDPCRHIQSLNSMHLDVACHKTENLHSCTRCKACTVCFCQAELLSAHENPNGLKPACHKN